MKITKNLNDVSDISEYKIPGENKNLTAYNYNATNVFYSNNYGAWFAIDEDGVQYITSSYKDFENETATFDETWSIVFIGNKALINGDEENQDHFHAPSVNGVGIAEDLGIHDKFPAISFICVARLLGLDNSYDVGPLFSSKTLEVIESAKDQFIPLTEEEKTLIRRNETSKLVSPGFGFTRVGYRWHKPSNVLFRDTRTDIYYLLGQDEGSYFGCELSGKPRSIKSAFLDLTPKEARNKPGVLRQGEWFAVPTSMPNIDNFTTFELSQDSYVVLPKEDRQSNDHILCFGKNKTFIHNGTCYVSGTWRLYHNDHTSLGPLDSKLIYAFYRNTAVQSVSVAGMD